MHVDILVAEIGSTTTVVNAFDGIGTGRPKFIGQGQAATSVLQGDVTIGLEGAIENLRQNLGADTISRGQMLATSSAAGGLKMSVHGLVYDMTVRAAREAALGAGAILANVTAGKMRRTELAAVQSLRPNIILVAGGVDYGERDTALNNFEKLAFACPDTPFIYAGNVQNQEEIRLIAAEKGVKVHIVPNVYPQVDVLDVEPTRKVIQDVFEEHIVMAPGMAKLRTMVNGKIMPTPGAVMQAAKMLNGLLGDLVVFDVGGATTDIHSVTHGSSEMNDILLSPEPFAKRTVEGDLGVFVNIPHVVEKIGMDELKRQFPNAETLIAEARAIPETDEQKRFAEVLTQTAVITALGRHAGKLTDIYGPMGKKTMATGKDLTAVRHIIGTGGALTRLPQREAILRKVMTPNTSATLAPRLGAEILIDNHYIMASLGALSLADQEAALDLMQQSIAADR